MKIASVKTHRRHDALAASGGRMWVFFKLITDNGIDEYWAHPTID